MFKNKDKQLDRIDKKDKFSSDLVFAFHLVKV